MTGRLSRLFGRRRARDGAAADPFASRPDRPSAEAEAFAALLGEVERAALTVYERHGLPTRPGHYHRAPNARDWTFIAETLTADQKFALALEHPRDAGWRFAARDDLGAAHTETPELVRASGALAGCAWLRARRGSAASEALASALKLGALWRDMVQAETLRPDIPPQASLPATPVDKPRRTRKKAALPTPPSKSAP